MRAVKRLRRVAVLGTLTLIVALFAVLAVADPFHLRHARWFTAGLVLLGILLLTSTLAAVVGRGVLRWLVVMVGGVAVLGWCALIGVASQISTPSRQISEVDDGGRRLVVLEGSAVAIDPVYAVVLRAGGGPFEQESVVYQGVEAAPVPADIRFVDGDTVEVSTSGGCVYRSEVEAVTLMVDPVHRPLRADGC
jgi:hypothetical protein